MLGAMKASCHQLRRRGLLLWLALLALLVSMGNPEISMPRDIRNYLFVVDITQSMNVRDMQVDGVAASKLA